MASSITCGVRANPYSLIATPILTMLSLTYAGNFIRVDERSFGVIRALIPLQHILYLGHIAGRNSTDTPAFSIGNYRILSIL